MAKLNTFIREQPVKMILDQQTSKWALEAGESVVKSTGQKRDCSRIFGPSLRPSPFAIKFSRNETS
jgi:hypothetical protein